MGSFEEARLAEVLPTVVAGPDGEALARVLGRAEDADQSLLVDGVLMRFAHRAPDDALDHVGRDRMRPRAPTPEALDHDAYRTRLVEQTWAHWETAPIKTGGMVGLFAPYGGTVVCYSNHDAPLDSNTTWWSRCFWLWDGALQPDANWDDDAQPYDDGGLWDIAYDPSIPSGFGVPDLDYLRRDIRRTKGSFTYPVVICSSLSPSGPLWDLGGETTWDDPGAPPWTDDVPHVFLPIGEVWEQEDIYGSPGAYGTWDSGDETWGDYYPPTGGW